MLLAADAEARHCYVTKRHAMTLYRMRPCRRRIDLRSVTVSDSEEEDEQNNEEVEDEEKIVKEILKIHVKRKKLLRKAFIDGDVRFLSMIL